jgi:hypothetical protein
MSGGGKQTVNNAPWSGAQPYFKDLYSAANTAFKNQAPPPTTNYAPVNDTQKNALTALQGDATKYTATAPTFAAAGDAQRGGVDAVRGLAGDTLSGKYMDPESNPWLKKAVDAAQFDTFRNFNEQTMPTIRSNSLLNGTYGGDRTDLIISRAMEGAMSDALRQANQIYAGNYATERGYQMQAPQLYGQANTIDNTGLSTILQGLGVGTQGSTMMGQTGDQLQQWDQQPIDAAWDLYNKNNEATWDPINRMLGVLTGGGYSTQSGGPSRGASIFQGAAGGGLNGYLAGQQFGGDPNTLALIGAALGGASGY